MNIIGYQGISGHSGDLEKNVVLGQLLVSGPKFLTSRLQVVEFHAGSTLYDVGDRVNYVYFPIDAVVSSLAVFQDGTTVESSMFGYDSLVGVSNILGSRQSQHWMQVSFNGRLAMLDIEDLIVAFSENSRCAKAILEAYDRLVTHISQRAVCNARHSVMERFCCWLLMVHDRHPEGSLKVTHEQVSIRLGTRRAGITVAARTLFEEGLVEYRRGVMRIMDRQSIERLACECYGVLRLNPEAASRNVVPSQRAGGALFPTPTKRSTTVEFPSRRLVT